MGKSKVGGKRRASKRLRDVAHTLETLEIPETQTHVDDEAARPMKKRRLRTRVPAKEDSDAVTFSPTPSSLQSSSSSSEPYEPSDSEEEEEYAEETTDPPSTSTTKRSDRKSVTYDNDVKSRGVRFARRRTGFIKKGREIATITKCQAVAATVSHETGRLHLFATPGVHVKRRESKHGVGGILTIKIPYKRFVARQRQEDDLGNDEEEEDNEEDSASTSDIVTNPYYNGAMVHQVTVPITRHIASPHSRSVFIRAPRRHRRHHKSPHKPSE